MLSSTPSPPPIGPVSKCVHGQSELSIKRGEGGSNSEGETGAGSRCFDLPNNF